MYDYSISKSAIKVRLTLDAFNPLVKEIVVDFSSGEELVVPLEYEHLDLHCTNCFALTHSSSQCPLLEPHISLATASHPRAAAESSHREALPAAPQPFNQRVDRHRRPFGDRVQPAARGNPLRNKLTPDLPHSARRNLEPVTRRRHDSPPHIRSERQHQSPRDARPQQYWREKVQQREPGPPPPL